jgi:hypothetical protein
VPPAIEEALSFHIANKTPDSGLAKLCITLNQQRTTELGPASIRRDKLVRRSKLNLPRVYFEVPTLAGEVAE